MTIYVCYGEKDTIQGISCFLEWNMLDITFG